MTVTPHIQRRVEAGLLAKAQAGGMDMQEYLQAIVEQEALQSSGETPVSEPTHRQEAVRRMLEFGERYRLSLGEPITREFLHQCRRF